MSAYQPPAGAAADGDGIRGWRARVTARLVHRTMGAMDVTEEHRKLLNRWRGVMRTMWTADNDPGSGPASGDQRGARNLRRMVDELRDLHERGPLVGQAARNAEKLQRHAYARVRELEPSVEAARALWDTVDGRNKLAAAAAATGTSRWVVTEGGPFFGHGAGVLGEGASSAAQRDGPLTADALKAQMVLIRAAPAAALDPPAPEGGAMAEDGAAAGVVHAAPEEDLLAPFREITHEAWATADAGWRAQHAPGRGPPPLNPDQRRVYRRLAEHLRDLWGWVEGGGH